MSRGAGILPRRAGRCLVMRLTRLAGWGALGVSALEQSANEMGTKKSRLVMIFFRLDFWPAFRRQGFTFKE